MTKKYLKAQKTCLKLYHREENQVLYKILLKYREAFSLRDKIGLCAYGSKIELNEKTPFYIKLLPIKQEEMNIADKDIRKGYLLEILRKGLSSNSSCIMLILTKISDILAQNLSH